MSDPDSWIFNLQAEKRPAIATFPQLPFPGVEEFCEKASASRMSDALYCVKAVVIHASGVPSTAYVMAVMKAARISRHWIIPNTSEPQHGHLVWAAVPDLRSALHVRAPAFNALINGGARNANRWTLAIDIICGDGEAGKPRPFSAWQVSMAARIVRHCWARFPNLAQVVAHAALEPGRVCDPGPEFPWQDLTSAIVEDVPPSPVEKAARGTPPMSDIAANPITLACCMHKSLRT